MIWLNPANLVRTLIHECPLDGVGHYKNDAEQIIKNLKRLVEGVKKDPLFKDLTPTVILTTIMNDAIKASMSGIKLPRIPNFVFKEDPKLIDMNGLTRFGNALKVVGTLDPPFKYMFLYLDSDDINQAVKDTVKAICPILQTDDIEFVEKLTKTAVCLLTVRSGHVGMGLDMHTYESLYDELGWDYDTEFLLVPKPMGGGKAIVVDIVDVDAEQAPRSPSKPPPISREGSVAPIEPGVGCSRTSPEPGPASRPRRDARSPGRWNPNVSTGHGEGSRKRARNGKDRA